MVNVEMIQVVRYYIMQDFLYLKTTRLATST